MSDDLYHSTPLGDGLARRAVDGIRQHQEDLKKTLDQ